MDEEGNLHLKSVDQDVCELILSANCLNFKVCYMQLLPNKKGDWVYQSETIGDDIISNSVYGRSQISYGKRNMRMLYEYAKIEQIHSIA
jgi:hypothetical protein